MQFWGCAKLQKKTSLPQINRWLHHVSLKSQLSKQLRCAPVLYADALDQVSSNLKSGDECVVVDASSRFPIARGVFNLSSSMYRVRILANYTTNDYTDASLNDIVARRIAHAKSFRRNLLLPSASTSAYRVINSEGDGLSGLIVDHIGNCLVVQSSAFWTEKYRELIESTLRDAYPSVHLVWQPQFKRLAEDGWTQNYVSSGTEETALGEQIVMENGVQYLVHVAEGQKTGFYCDQREQRSLLRRIAEGNGHNDTALFISFTLCRKRCAGPFLLHWRLCIERLSRKCQKVRGI